MIRIKIKDKALNENILAFGCKGFGWIRESDLDKKYVDVQLEDNYNGYRGYGFYLKEIEVCEEQPEYPY